MKFTEKPKLPETNLTLAELFDLCFSIDNVEIRVVKDELDTNDLDAVTILCTLKSDMKADVYLNDKFANAKVSQIFALERDVIIAAIDIDL